MNNQIKIGKLYKHFKGNVYEVVGIGKDSETLVDVVIYKPYGLDTIYWVRPLEMFVSLVTFDGKIVPRFELLNFD